MELFKLFGTIAVENSDAKSAIDETTDHAEKSQSKISSAFGKIGNAAVKAGKVIATGIAVGTVAITALGKQALDSYADFEQLVGGVETLYGTEIESIEEYAKSVGKTASEVAHEYEMMMNRQNAVMDNASKAYKTAGLSANEYMETVNGFAASLTASLGEYEWQAAGYADMIVTDMADNANKMGSSMESIQNAYSGFAKQNFTMLDNLKLGYGGTKTEMERLMRDAEKYAGYIEGSLDVSSFADVADAINIIQGKLGITGTTAKEASATISGSFATMKSAWKNLLTGLGNEDADLSGLIGNFVDSASTVADNVMPRVEVILGGMADAIGQIIPIIGERLPVLFESILPPLIEGAVALINGLVAALPALLEILLPQIPFIIEQIGLALIAVFPQLLEVCQNLFGQLWDYFSLNLLNTGVSFQDTLAVISQFFSDAWTEMQTIWASVGQPIWDMISFALDSLVVLFMQNMPAIQQFFQDAIAGILDTWENHLKPALEAIGAFLNDVVKPAFEYVFTNVIMPLVQTAFQFIVNLWNGTLKPVLDGICDFLTGLFTLNWQKMKDSLISILNALHEGAKNIFNSIKSFLSNVWSNIKGDVTNKLNSIKTSVSNAFNNIKATIQTKIQAAKDKVFSVFRDIKDGIKSRIESARDTVKNAIDRIKGFFNFQWSLPHLKMPHPYISGSFSLDPPSVPSFGIDWYKKAMDDPIIMNSPTAFGINKLGQVMAGGEAGSEVVSGTDTLMNMISEAVAAKNARLEAILANILSFMMEYMPQMANMQLVTDTGALIGELAPGMDEALGILARREERGI